MIRVVRDLGDVNEAGQAVIQLHESAVGLESLHGSVHYGANGNGGDPGLFFFLSLCAEQLSGGENQAVFLLVQIGYLYLDFLPQIFVQVVYMAQSQSGSGDEAADAFHVGDNALIYDAVHRYGQGCFLPPGTVSVFSPGFLILILESVKGFVHSLGKNPPMFMFSSDICYHLILIFFFSIT